MTKTKNEETPYAFIYDTAYKLPSKIEYEKAMKRAIKAGEINLAEPIYKNMYSDNKHYPHYKMKKTLKNLIPKTFMRDFDTVNQNINSYLLRYAEVGCNPNQLQHLIPDMYACPPQPEGLDRWRYMTTPLKPMHGSMIPPDVKMTAKAIKDAYFNKIEKIVEIPTRTIGTQTDYRDSSTQTEPYSPDFLIRPGAHPEILSLVPLSYNEGLPPGLHEVMAFERARRQKIYEEAYQKEFKGNIETNYHLMRKKRLYLHRMEMAEWKIREEQINELQFARLRVIAQLIQERRGFLNQMHEELIERVVIERSKIKDFDLNKAKYNHSKQLRKILKHRLNLEIYSKKITRIELYNDPHSQIWAPLARIGQFMDKGSERYKVDNKYINDVDGLKELENSLPPYVLNPRLKISKLEMYTKDGFKKKRYRFEDELKRLYDYLRSKRGLTEKVKVSKPLKFLRKVEHPPFRPPTPCLEFSNTDQIDKELMVTFLQQLIRGRAVQVMMYEGKEKRIDLIKELRSTHAIQTAEIEMKKQQKMVAIGIQRAKNLQDHREETAEEILNNAHGESLGDIYDFLGKELIRLQEERRLHAFMMMAYRERRMREAEESGLRQLEERRRREEDEMFKQIIKTHQITIDSYLNTLIKTNMEYQAEETAKITVQNMATKINKEAYEIEKNRNYLKTEEIVSDLVHHFLIPEVYKKDARDRIALQQSKYLLVAHREIVHTIDEVVQNNPISPILNTQSVSVHTNTNCGSTNENNTENVTEQIEPDIYDASINDNNNIRLANEIDFDNNSANQIDSSSQSTNENDSTNLSTNNNEN